MQWHNTAASLFAQQHRATKPAFCPEECCTALVFGEHTPVWRAKLDRCKCSGTTLLPACLHSNTEPQSLHFALKSAAPHWCLVIATFVWIAKLDRCKCSGTTLLPACLHSNTEQQSLHFALKSAAPHWCLVIATFVWRAKLDRCKCSGTTLLPACLHSSTEQQSLHSEEFCTALVFCDCNICVDRET